MSTPKRKTRNAVYICGSDDRVFPDTSDCRRNELHTPMPRNFLDQSNWAERMLQTHAQQRCPGCGMWKVWVPKDEAAEVDEEQLALPEEPMTLRITPTSAPQTWAPPPVPRRCRKRREASAMRCMGQADHDGIHWAWKGPKYQEWTGRECSEVEAKDADAT